MNYALKEMSQQDIRFLLLKLSGSNLYCQQLSQESFVKVEEFHKLIYIFVKHTIFPRGCRLHSQKPRTIVHASQAGNPNVCKYSFPLYKKIIIIIRNSNSRGVQLMSANPSVCVCTHCRNGDWWQRYRYTLYSLLT